MHSNRFLPIALVSLVAFGGCRTVQQQFNQPISARTSSPDATHHYEPKQSSVRQVGFVQDEQPSDAGQIGGNSLDFETVGGVVTPVSQMENVSASLEHLEQTAIATNPAIQELQAELESLRGKLTQAGLPPNPTAGINAEDINEDGGSGRYGVYFGRQIVRGNKLNLSRSVVCAEIKAAEQRLAVIEQRLLTDVRQRYYDLLVAQEKVSITNDLVKISQNAVDVSKKLVEAQEAARTAVLQSELELQNAIVVQRQAENQRVAARRKLAALLGESNLPFEFVDGDVRSAVDLDEFEQSYDQLVNSSPEIAALFAEVEQQRRQLARECAEPIPNLTWQTTLQYDTVGDDVVAGFQFGMPIPTLNRNQGAIHQARYQIVAAERRAEKKALNLRQRLASAYEGYLDAKLQIDAYDSEIIPKAKETLELVTKGYQQGETDFIQLLTAQRTYSQINLTYLTQLQQLWRQNVEIKGKLLSGSLE